MKEFRKTNKTTITRLPKRGSYDQDTIYSILDEALYCTLSWSDNDQPFQIPTGFCRIGDKLYPMAPWEAITCACWRKSDHLCVLVLP